MKQGRMEDKRREAEPPLAPLSLRLMQAGAHPTVGARPTAAHGRGNAPRLLLAKVGGLRQTCLSRKSPKSQKTRDYPSQIRIMFDRRRSR